MKTWKAWTTRDLAALEQMRMDGLTAAAIALKLGRTQAAIKCRLQSEAIRRPLASGRWLALLQGPHRIADVAAAAGTTKWAVKQAKRKLRRAGFDIPAAIRDSTTVSS